MVWDSLSADIQNDVCIASCHAVHAQDSVNSFLNILFQGRNLVYLQVLCIVGAQATHHEPAGQNLFKQLYFTRRRWSIQLEPHLHTAVVCGQFQCSHGGDFVTVSYNLGAQYARSARVYDMHVQLAISALLPPVRAAL